MSPEYMYQRERKEMYCLEKEDKYEQRETTQTSRTEACLYQCQTEKRKKSH